MSLKRSANRCLLQYYDISETFLGRVQAGDFSKLREFELKRDTQLRILNFFNGKICEIAQDDTPDSKFNCQYEVFQKISQLDLQICEILHAELCRTQLELRDFQAREKNFKNFRSTWKVKTGEALDCTL